MKTIRNIFQKTAIALTCATIFSSCLKEDMSNCPEQIRIYFDIFSRAGNEEINPAEVDRMNLYVFNSKGYFLREYKDNSIVGFSQDYYMDCSDLLPGKYSIIAWAGMDSKCYSTIPEKLVKGKTTIEEALLTLKLADKMVAEKVHHLFHSDISATVTTDKVQHFKMPLIQHTNTVNIRTIGLQNNENTYSFEIEDNNGTYLFDRSFATTQQPDFIYTKECVKDELNQLHSTLNIMRLSADKRSPQLRIINNFGSVLYPVGSQSGNLIDMILKSNPDNDFEKTHTYDILFIFSDENEGIPTDIAVSIYINGWQVKEEDGDLH